MPKLRLTGTDDAAGRPPQRDALQFPTPPPPPAEDAGDRAEEREHEALAALREVSRRMEDLARALGCLGYFDDDDRPRAA